MAAPTSGAALATCLARVIELALLLLASYRQKHLVAVTHWSALCGMESGLLHRFLATSLPLVLTELVWVLGESAYGVVYGRMGTEQLAAMTMTYPLQGLSIGLLCGLSGAASVLIGHRLGASDFAGAISYANRLIRLGGRRIIKKKTAMALLDPYKEDL